MLNILDPKYHRPLFLLGLVVSLLLLLGRFHTTKSVAGGDAVYYYMNLRSIVIDGDIDFRNEYGHFYNQVSPYTGNRKIPEVPSPDPRTGMLPNKYTIGTTVLLAPFFYLGHLSAITLNRAGFPVETDGYGSIYMLSAGVGSLIYGFLGVLLMYRLGKKLFNAEIAFVASLSAWLATPLIYYMAMDPLMSHATSMFTVTLFLYIWLSGREKGGLWYWAALGITGGIMSMVRSQDIFFGIAPVVDAALMRFASRDHAQRESLGTLVVMLAVFSAFFALTGSPQFYVNYLLYGSPLTNGYSSGNEGFIFWNSPKLLYSLFSIHNGLFIWTPVAALSLFGAVRLALRDRLPGSILLLLFAIQVYLVSAWWSYTQGHTFGNRMMVNSTMVLGLGLMEVLRINTGGRFYKSLTGLCCLLIIVNAVLAGLFCLRIVGDPY